MDNLSSVFSLESLSELGWGVGLEPGDAADADGLRSVVVSLRDRDGEPVDGATVGLDRPSGLDISGGLIFVTDNDDAQIFAFDTEGTLLDYLDFSMYVEQGALMGVAVAADGALFLIDGNQNRILRVEAP